MLRRLSTLLRTIRAVVLHSNHAECMIQLGRNLKAKVSAEAALAIDPAHDKSSKRLEKAVQGIQKDKAGY